MNNKRLFLFAAYDAQGCVDASLVHYVAALSKYGDVVLFGDSDISKSELKKLSPYVLNADAAHHGEYDFGSYKRAYIWARDNQILQKYDYLYLVNDSVYGPLYDLQESLNKMESCGMDAFGLVKNPHREHPHIQSWFIGCTPSVFHTKWFDEFMMAITKLPAKGAITRLYEQGFSKMVVAHGLQWDCLYTVRGRGVYNKIKKLYRVRMPFMKKNAFPRRHGGLGRQILYVLNHVPSDTRDAIMENACRVYGDEYIHWLLTKNPFKIIYRTIQHFIHKLRTEGI